jgi:hypothetical protein
MKQFLPLLLMGVPLYGRAQPLANVGTNQRQTGLTASPQLVKLFSANRNRPRVFYSCGSSRESSRPAAAVGQLSYAEAGNFTNLGVADGYMTGSGWRTRYDRDRQVGA